MAIQSVALAPKIEKETEKQRHHVRVSIAAVIILDNHKYKTEDVSAGGFSITADRRTFDKGEQNVKVHFPFHNLAFHLNLNAKPIYFNPHTGKIGYTFSEIDPRQLSFLNMIIKSSLTGEIASHGEFMEVIKQNNAPVPENYPHSRWSRIIPLALIAIAGITGLVLLGGSIYENTSMVKSYTAVIEADTYTVRAESQGIYNSLLANGATKVTKGQELAVLKQPNTTTPRATAAAIEGETATAAAANASIIRSPCDCYVFKSYVKESEYRAMGESLFELLPLQPNSWVTASIRPDQAHSLRLQDDAYVQLLGENKFIEGHISAFLPPNFENGTTQIQIKTTKPLPPEAVGKPAYVEFIIF
jgi:mannuronan synthase